MTNKFQIGQPIQVDNLYGTITHITEDNKYIIDIHGRDYKLICNENQIYDYLKHIRECRTSNCVHCDHKIHTCTLDSRITNICKIRTIKKIVKANNNVPTNYIKCESTHPPIYFESDQCPLCSSNSQ